ncbi:FGGY-family carbohydrate kinase [Desemzia sp. RIT804]|uniref:xylulokinase n=1 Tax=Desemzia sp. RIT 804 TaxID=2810209 RepID=UPI00194FC838|nr:FGGY-family carbohydrate kinase [Desemzia sp. RIT 804]MBM6614506.1 FGGY-family carbohydrate kinase [Desemzia sp. RIT 804]
MNSKLEKAKKDILNKQTSLGIELGSTRIKAVLIDSQHQPIASGSYEWENQLEDGVWTYSLDQIWKGLQGSYQAMTDEVQERYGEVVNSIGSIGFSAMMHGYLAFDKQGELLVPFRTWRNAMTESSEKELTNFFNYPIPQRWSIAHLHQAILNDEEHVKEIDFFTTLAGYVHWKMTGEKVIGVGDASGMFPIDTTTKNYHQKMLHQYSDLIKEKEYSWQIESILPKILVAGDNAGILTEEGADLLDPSGNLNSGIPICPPEGDAGTGMTATNSVSERTGNISAGTSAFAMIVLEKELKRVHPEIDLVTTPTGSLVGMVHTNNCSSDMNAWVNLFAEFASAAGLQLDKNDIFALLFKEALKGDLDGGGLLSYGYYSGENITRIDKGRPLFVRQPDSRFTLANFMRVHLFTAFGAMKIGMDILTKEEKINIDKIVGHGGIFKTKEVGQHVMASVMNAPVTVMETAGEGGAWGIALLAAYLREKESNEPLADFLESKVFKDEKGSTIEPLEEEVVGFEVFVDRYKKGLPIEQAAIDFLN